MVKNCKLNIKRHHQHECGDSVFFSRASSTLFSQASSTWSLLLVRSKFVRFFFLCHYDSGVKEHLQYWHILLISSFEMGHFIFNFCHSHTISRLHVANWLRSLSSDILKRKAPQSSHSFLVLQRKRVKRIEIFAWFMCTL